MFAKMKIDLKMSSVKITDIKFMVLLVLYGTKAQTIYVCAF